MARIRTIKPEFWADEKLAPCDATTRLVFLGLISMADDRGRIIDNEKQIEAFIFPLSDASRETRESLATLSRLGRIRRGTSRNGQRVVEITHWERHQKVDKPSTRGLVPEIVVCDEVTNSGESLDESSRDSRETFATGSRILDPVPGSTSSTSTTAREAFLSRLDSGQRVGWLALLNGWTEGMGTPGGKAYTAEQVDAGLAEYLANEPEPTFAPRHVVRYVEQAANRKANEPAPKPRRAHGDTGFLASVIAEEEAKRKAQEVPA